MNFKKEFVAATAIGLFSAGTAWAAENGEASGGMPQLDPSTFASQIFWLAVTFGALYYIMSKKALPAIESVMAERNARRQADLDAATKLRAEAEEAYAAYERQLQDAAAQAQSAIAAAKTKVGDDIAAKTSELEADLDAQIEQAAGEVRSSASEALKSVEDVAAEVAQAAVERLIGVKVTKDEALAAMAAVK